MGKGRLEAFSDGVIAIIITIMVLELKAPEDGGITAWRPMFAIFLSYVLSFVYVGIYWNNHHHMLHTVQKVNGAILWANLHLLFWLSLTPATTSWVGHVPGSPVAAALYGFVLLMCGTAYLILSRAIIRYHGRDSTLARATGKDWKGKFSLIAYLLAIPLAFLTPWMSYAIYTVVAIIWFLPDRRIEKVLHE